LCLTNKKLSQLRDCLNQTRHSIDEVNRIPPPLALTRLPPVPAPDEQLDGTPERVDALREAARAPGEPRQVVPELGAVAFDRISLRFVIRRSVLAPPAQLAVGVEGVGEVPCGMWRGVDDTLHHLRRALPADLVRDDAP